MLNIMVSRRPEELWGRSKSEPEWQMELGDAGEATGVLVNRKNPNNRLRMKNGKWEGVRT